MRIYCVYTETDNLLYTADPEEAGKAQHLHENAMVSSVEADEPEPGETLETVYLRTQQAILDGIKNQSKAFLGFV